MIFQNTFQAFNKVRKSRYFVGGIIILNITFIFLFGYFGFHLHLWLMSSDFDFESILIKNAEGYFENLHNIENDLKKKRQ